MRIGSGRFKGRKLPVPRGARPVGARLKTSLFSVLATRLPGARVLDVCAGAGGFGLEALSRGAADVTLVDLDRGAVRAVNAWIEEVGAANEARAVGGSWLKGPLPPGPFDVIFLDPPFITWTDPVMARDVHVTGFARLRERIAGDGVLAAKLPVRREPPVLAGWRELRRTTVGSSAYVLWVPETSETVKPPSPMADPETW